MGERLHDKPVTYGRIVRFWSPLAGGWLMMSVEGPFLAAIIARLQFPIENLAAYGVAFAFALIIEAPVIMLLSAATALVKDRSSYLALRRFTYMLNAALTALMVVTLLPPVFRFLTGTLLNLPEQVAALTYGAVILMLPWPSAIGYRRFLQGTLVRHDMTRRVAYGTVVRLLFMMIGAAIGSLVLGLPGAQVGALGLSTGVVAEAIASRLMAAGIIAELRAGKREETVSAPVSQSEIASFYFPLATMSILAMAIHPMVTFFMGRSRMPLESLAILPVVHGLTFFFRSLGLSYQEVTIALVGEQAENLAKLRRFAAGLAAVASGGLALIAFTPLAASWFGNIAGLSPELTALALLPIRIAAILPALTVLMAFQRALLVSARLTAPLTTATIIEVAGIAIVLSLAIFSFDLMGAVAAMTALVMGRLVGSSYLMPPTLRAVEKLRGTQEPEPVPAG